MIAVVREFSAATPRHENSSGRVRTSGGSATSSHIAAPEHNILVLIPARDESAAVGAVVNQVRQSGWPVLVIDDHSQDDTAKIARASGARVLKMPFHCGCWGALQTGMRYALAHGYRNVITMDADGQHLAPEIPKLIELAKQPPGQRPSIIVGACIERANRRRRIAWQALRMISGLDIVDLTSGFRYYDRRAMRLLVSPHCSLIEYQDIAVLLYLHRHRLRILETPVRMLPRRHGRSRVFYSWPMVIYYLIYSTLIGGTRRTRAKYRALDRRRRRKR